MEKVLGYDYDKKAGKLNINEEESKIVKATFDLVSSYKLRNDEVFNLLTKDLSLDQVINFRVFKIQNALLYEYGKKVDFGNILEIISNNDNIGKNLINPLLEIKDSMKEEYEENKINSFLEKIDDVIKLLQDKSNIINKYNNFDEISETIQKINSNKGKHERIIDKDTWEKANKILKDNKLKEELEEVEK